MGLALRSDPAKDRVGTVEAFSVAREADPRNPFSACFIISSSDLVARLRVPLDSHPLLKGRNSHFPLLTFERSV